MKHKAAFEMEVYMCINPNLFTIYVILKSHLMFYNSAVNGRSTELALVLCIIVLNCYAMLPERRLVTSLFECVCCYVRKHADEIRMLTKAVMSLLLCVTLQLFRTNKN